MKQQAEELKKKPHIVIGTPGRILDHLKKTKEFNFKLLKYLVSAGITLQLKLKIEF